MIKHIYGYQLCRIAVLGSMIFGLAACASQSETSYNKGLGADTKVVRGVNQTYCDATAIGNGSNPKVGKKEDMTNLSVSCSDNKKVSFDDLRAPLPSPHFCQTTIGKLRKKNKSVVIVSDPVPTNRYHCLLSRITPNQFVAGSKYWP